MQSPVEKYHQLLLKVLDIVSFESDKDAFIQKMGQLMYVRSLNELFSSLSAEQQQSIKKELLEVEKDPAQVETVINKYFTLEQQDAVLEKSATKVMTEYIDTIKDTLSPTQKEELIKFTEELSIQSS